MSPSRSPSGPTYTQLSGGNPRQPTQHQPQQQNYHPSSAPQTNAGKWLDWKSPFEIPQTNIPSVIAGMWGWQNTNQSDQGPGPSGGPIGNHSVPAVTSTASANSQSGATDSGGQELTEMLTMLDQSGGTTFADLNINMFNTPFE